MATLVAPGRELRSSSPVIVMSAADDLVLTDVGRCGESVGRGNSHGHAVATPATAVSMAMDTLMMDADEDSVVPWCFRAGRLLQNGDTSRALPLLIKAVAWCQEVERQSAADRGGLQDASAANAPNPLTNDDGVAARPSCTAALGHVDSDDDTPYTEVVLQIGSDRAERRERPCDGTAIVEGIELFNPFEEGDRVAPPALRLWAAGAMAETPPVVRPRRMQEVLCRNELDVRGLGAPRDFNSEAVLVAWQHENYVKSELRPAFLGTFAVAASVANLARPSLDFDWANPFAMPRAAGVLYDVDSGDDWDGDDDDASVAGTQSDCSGDSAAETASDDGFVIDDDVSDDANVSGHDAERDDNEMLKSEAQERAQCRKQGSTQRLVPRFDGVFDEVPLARHPLHMFDRLEFTSGATAATIRDGLEYLHIARTVFQQAGLAIPEEQLKAAEQEAMAAKAAREAARAELLKAGVSVTRHRGPRSAVPKGTDPSAAVPPSEGRPAGRRRRFDVVALCDDGDATEDDDPDDLPLCDMLTHSAASTTVAARRTTAVPMAAASLRQPRRVQPRPPSV